MSSREKRADWLFVCMAVWVVCINLFGGRFLRYLPVWARLISSEVCYLVPIVLFLAIGRVNVREMIPHKPLRLSTLGMTVLFVILLQPLMICLNVFTMLFSNNYVLEAQTGLTMVPVWMQLLCIGVVPALAEEFMFRGVYYGSYRGKGILAAAVFSGLVFGLFHLNFNQFGYAFMLGISFALLVEATGSIVYSMAGHFVINGWSVLVSAFSDQILEATGTTDSLEVVAETMTQEMLVNSFCIYVVIAAVSTCLAGAVYIWILKHSGRAAYLREGWKVPKTEDGQSAWRVSPVFAAGAAICVLFMIYRDWMAG